MSDNKESSLSVNQEAALKEYEMLRQEILGRVVMRDQMVNYATALFGAIAGAAALIGKESDPDATAWVLLAYPPIATVFAWGWVTHDLRIWDMGKYIREDCQNSLPQNRHSRIRWAGRRIAIQNAKRRLTLLRHFLRGDNHFLASEPSGARR